MVDYSSVLELVRQELQELGVVDRRRTSTGRGPQPDVTLICDIGTSSNGRPATPARAKAMYTVQTEYWFVFVAQVSGDRLLDDSIDSSWNSQRFVNLPFSSFGIMTRRTVGTMFGFPRLHGFHYLDGVRTQIVQDCPSTVMPSTPGPPLVRLDLLISSVQVVRFTRMASRVTISLPSHVAAFVLSRPSSLCSPPVLPCSAGVPLRDFSAINGLSATSDASCYRFQPFPSTIRSVLWPLLTSHDKLYSDAPNGAASVRPPRVKHALSPHAAASFTPTAPCSCRTSLCLASLSAVDVPDEVLVHQLKGLPPASFSLRLATHTLLLAMRLPLPAPLGTFTR